jgi:hypothetical protein
LIDKYEYEKFAQILHVESCVQNTFASFYFGLLPPTPTEDDIEELALS